VVVGGAGSSLTVFNRSSAASPWQLSTVAIPGGRSGATFVASGPRFFGACLSGGIVLVDPLDTQLVYFTASTAQTCAVGQDRLFELRNSDGLITKKDITNPAQIYTEQQHPAYNGNYLRFPSLLWLGGEPTLVVAQSTSGVITCSPGVTP
jgi:hypothetical protein